MNFSLEEGNPGLTPSSGESIKSTEEKEKDLIEMTEVHEKSKLPPDHPEYLYLPSRNPYSQKLKKEFSEKAFSGNEGEVQRGKWKSKFPNPHSPLHVEVGCNAGHVVCEWAKKNPNQNYIGLDYKFKAIYHACEKAKKHNLENVFFLRANAIRLPYLFSEEEIDSFYLFFPDPWETPSKAENRFVSQKNISKLIPLIKKNGIIHIKTDHDDYFQEIIQTFHGFSDQLILESKTSDKHSVHPYPEKLEIPEVTLFEKIWIREKIKIKEMIYRKK